MPLRYNLDMGYVLVPPTQPRIAVAVAAVRESDPGPYPVPENLPIEGWPTGYQTGPLAQRLNLDDVQRDVRNLGGDRHAIVVDPAQRRLYEFFAMRKTGISWEAGSMAIFDLTSNKLRPDGWTSATPLVCRFSRWWFVMTNSNAGSSITRCG